MKLIEVVAEKENLVSVQKVVTEDCTECLWWTGGAEGKLSSVRLLVEDKHSQETIDKLYGLLGPHGRIIISDPDAVLPHQETKDEDGGEDKKSSGTSATREELYENIEKGARLDGSFLLLVMLSTIVAAIGLIADNVAVVVGAMVIAPLLGPNIALALATALGDTALMAKSIKSNLVGIVSAIALSGLLGRVWPAPLDSFELLSRTNVGLDSVALALASGAAAALSLTTGLSSVLVGVMVAVALLPPAATLGLMLGGENFGLAAGAGLLLAVNIVCVNLAAKIVFLVKGIKPRTWFEIKRARQSNATYMILWILSLALLIGIILAKQQLAPSFQ